VHWHSVGSGCARDREISEYARENAYALLTNDLDFPQILAHTKESASSIIVLRGEPLVPEARGGALLRALADCALVLQQGAILTLDWSGRPRARILPLL
jgi:predicted nuclease of predicted toxin-antitoxin system